MKRWTGILLLGVMITVGLAAKKSYLVEGGKVHYRDGRFEKADSLFLESIQKEMAVAEAYMWHGKTSIRLDDPVEAARAFLKVTELDPAGEIIGEDEEAPELAQIALYFGAQRMLYEGSKSDSVIMFLKKAIELDSTRETNYVLLGRFYLQNRELEKALEVAEELEAVAPNSADVPYLRGRVSLAKSNFQEAADYFQTSVQRFKSDLETVSQTIKEQLDLAPPKLDSILAALRQAEKAQEQITMDDRLSLLSQKFGMPAPQANAFLRWRSGFTGKQRQLADAYDRLGQTYVQMGEYAKADSVLTKALQIDPENIEVLWYKGLASYSLKDYAEAITQFEKVAEQAQDDYYVHLYLGICYLKDETKDLEKAEQYLNKAKDINPDQPDVYCNLAVLAREKGNIEEASELLKLCKALKKGEPLSLTASELYQAYEDNEVAADKKYKGTTIEVSGIIQEIAKDIVDKEPYVALKAGGNELATVRCYFPKERENTVAQLSKGQKVTIEGKCEGKNITAVVLKGCSL